MKCTFVAIGSENISIQALSAMLKRHGHETTLAYDQSLFDDRNYLHMPMLARFFKNRETVLAQIERSRPDLVAISVLTPTYQWALDIARSVKRRLGVMVLFGGTHPSTLPELVIAQDCVDMICVGEGDYAMAELCDSIDSGALDTAIPNIWFKVKGTVIRNPQRPLVDNLDQLPMPDKALFARHIPMGDSYLAVTARGCPFTCSYCECSWQAEEIKRLGGRKLRERSPGKVIEELLFMHERYGFKWVDFRNNTFTATPRWVHAFLSAYQAQLRLPFRIFGHPMTIDFEIARMLKDAGCFCVQLGVESLDPRIRSEMMNRHETNEQIYAAVDAMDRVGLSYSCDYILGVPGQTDEELSQAAAFFSKRKCLARVSSFMLAYQPRLKINQKGIEYGHISETEIVAMENGEHLHYVAEGSIGKDPRRLAHYNSYRLLFRIIPLLPSGIAKRLPVAPFLSLLKALPAEICLRLLDLFMLFRTTDRDARSYFKNYAYWIASRFNPKHPAYAFGKRSVSGCRDNNGLKN